MMPCVSASGFAIRNRVANAATRAALHSLCRLLQPARRDDQGPRCVRKAGTITSTDMAPIFDPRPSRPKLSEEVTTSTFRSQGCGIYRGFINVVSVIAGGHDEQDLGCALRGILETAPIRCLARSHRHVGHPYTVRGHMFDKIGETAHLVGGKTIDCDARFRRLARQNAEHRCAMVLRKEWIAPRSTSKGRSSPSQKS